MFDFTRFLKDFNIPIPDFGKNTGRGWVNITCPFCGDTKNHLGFNYIENYFSCWKCDDGHGSGYHKIESVIEKLVPHVKADDILKIYETNKIYVDKIHKKLNKKLVKQVKLPGSSLQKLHTNYLEKRKYNVDMLVTKYKIKGTTHIGNYRYRIIIPIFYKNQLVTYQTRAINAGETRYINADPENEIISIKDILYNLDNCKKDYCVLTEGVTKVWRLGDDSLASLGKNYTLKQLKILVNNFKIVYIWFDNDLKSKINYGQAKAKKIVVELKDLGLEVYNIISDLPPDDISQKEADEFMNELR